MWNNPIKSGEAILKYIPQRPPFVMIDKLFEKGDNFIVSGLQIANDNVLVEEGKFQAGGLIENIAQTAALFAGVNLLDNGKEMAVGYIAGIKNLQVNQLPAVAEELFTKINLTHDLGNIQVVEGTVMNVAGSVLASCELRIFLNANE